jgi:hypothetical protein
MTPGSWRATPAGRADHGGSNVCRDRAITVQLSDGVDLTTHQQGGRSFLAAFASFSVARGY